MTLVVWLKQTNSCYVDERTNDVRDKIRTVATLVMKFNENMPQKLPLNEFLWIQKTSCGEVTKEMCTILLFPCSTMAMKF